MASRERTKARTLEIRCSFEPNRMAQACLEDAYEYVVPTVRRTVQVQPSTDASRVPALRRRAGGVAW